MLTVEKRKSTHCLWSDWEPGDFCQTHCYDGLGEIWNDDLWIDTEYFHGNLSNGWYFTLSPLNFESTIKLATLQASLLCMLADHRKFLKSLVMSQEEGQLLFGPDILHEQNFSLRSLEEGFPLAYWEWLVACLRTKLSLWKKGNSNMNRMLPNCHFWLV